MKQKWPILIFSALLTASIVLAGIWGNAQFEHLHSGSVLTAEHAAQGIALDGWRQEAPGQWHFTFTVGEDIPSLTLCVTNTAAPLAHEGLTSLERSGELYALDVAPGETVELVFTCGRSPQTWLMTSAFASRAFRFRTMTQLIALTAFVTMGMVLLALYHYKHLPELGYFLLYLVIMSVWALMVFFFPAIRNSLLQLILRSFFSLTVLASALLAAGLLGVKLPRSGRGLLALAAGCVVFFALSMSSYPPLRVGMLVAGMCLCLYYLMAAVNADYEGAALMLLPGAVTTGFRVWALMPGLDSVLFVEVCPLLPAALRPPLRPSLCHRLHGVRLPTVRSPLRPHRAAGPGAGRPGGRADKRADRRDRGPQEHDAQHLPRPAQPSLRRQRRAGNTGIGPRGPSGPASGSASAH